MSFDSRLEKLLTQVRQITRLGNISAIVDWDQQVNLPSGAADGRAEHQETLELIRHRLMTSAEYADALEKALRIPFAADSDEAALLRVLKRNYDKAKAVPAELSAALVRQQAATMAAWEAARKAEDFALVQPELEKLVSLKREYAACFPGGKGVYSVLMDDFEEGLTEEELDPIVEEMGRELPGIADAIIAKQQIDDDFLALDYDHEKQIDACRDVVALMGFDFTRGRMDRSTHPFTTTFDIDDIRITTRTRLNEPTNCLFSCIHECGHAIYEQSIDRKYRATPLADGASLAFHESQSRFWENIAGRSLQFWRQAYPLYAKHFPENLGNIPVERFVKAVNVVRKSYVRTEADEVTYNLHILMRTELERALVSGALSCADLPAAWDSKFEQYFGLRPRSLCEGVLQDVHWYCGSIGYFPTYMLGNLIGGMLLETLFPNGLPDDIAAIRGVLQDKIYRFGSKYTPKQLLEKTTGHSAVSCTPFLNYLRKKYL